MFDYDNVYNVDDDNSFANFLETMQKVDVSIGLELDNGSIEWLKMESLYLDDWKSQKGCMRFTACDRLSFMTDTYSAGNTIHTRTLYSDAEDVLEAAGLEPDEYEIDDCLADITVTNPLPAIAQNACLQLIANAGRCVLYQSRDGKICIKANFANVIEPDDIVVTSTGASAWSKPNNVTKGSLIVYADMTKNFFSTDGSMKFMPSSSSQYSNDTGFISSQVANASGYFTANPTITLALQAGYTYYSLYVDFDGNPPKNMTSMSSMGSDKTYTSMIYASNINNIESNVEKLNLNSYNLSIGNKTTYSTNGSTPLWSEFNRIESAILLLYNTMTAHQKHIKRKM